MGPPSLVLCWDGGGCGQTEHMNDKDKRVIGHEDRDKRALALRDALIQGLESGEPVPLDAEKLRADVKKRAGLLGKQTVKL